MTIITREGKPPMNTYGDLPVVGKPAPNFTLTNTSMENVTLESFKGKYVILNIFPSADTPTCEKSIVKFENEAAAMPNTVVLNISMDLPFAHKRFCTAKGFTKENVISLSAMPRPDVNNFGKDYGVTIMDGYMRGAFARGVVVINPEGIVVHNELVKELTHQPNYETCLACIPKSGLTSASTSSEREAKESKESADVRTSESGKDKEAGQQMTKAFDATQAQAGSLTSTVATAVAVVTSSSTKPEDHVEPSKAQPTETRKSATKI